MSDQPAPDTSAPAGEGGAVSPTSSAAVDDLDAALQEWDREVGPAEPGKPAATPDPAQQLSIAREQLDTATELGELRTWAEGVQYERLVEREKKDADAAIELGRSTIAGIEHIPGDFADRWLSNEYTVNAELHAAWDDRYASPDAERGAQRCVRHAVKALQEQAKRESARIAGIAASEDKASIVAAMARGTGKTPEGRAPDFPRITDKELNEYTEKNFGFSI